MLLILLLLLPIIGIFIIITLPCNDFFTLNFKYRKIAVYISLGIFIVVCIGIYVLYCLFVDPILLESISNREFAFIIESAANAVISSKENTGSVVCTVGELFDCLDDKSINRSGVDSELAKRRLHSFANAYLNLDSGDQQLVVKRFCSAFHENFSDYTSSRLSILRFASSSSAHSSVSWHVINALKNTNF